MKLKQTFIGLSALALFSQGAIADGYSTNNVEGSVAGAASAVVSVAAVPYLVSATFAEAISNPTKRDGTTGLGKKDDFPIGNEPVTSLPSPASALNDG